MSIIEEETIVLQVECDYCGRISRPLRDEEKLPRGWIEHIVRYDWKPMLAESPELANATGMVGGSTRYHFCRRAHFEKWMKLPRGPLQTLTVTLKDEFK